MIQDILEAIRDTMKANPRLANITAYHLVDGMLAGVRNFSVCIGCNKLRYSDYDGTQDEVIAPVRIYLYKQDSQAERGETDIRKYTNEIRYTLLENQYLGGLVDAMTVTDISFDSADVSTGQFIHFAAIDTEVKYYELRQRPDADIPTAEEIEATFNDETIEIEL